MASNAAQYLSRLLGAMSSGGITELKEKQRKRVAAIITGLQILSNPKYHEVLKLKAGEFEDIKNKLTSKTTADRVASIGTRAPSMLAKNEQNIVHWETRSLTTKKQLAQAVKQLALDIDKNTQQAQKAPQQPQKQEPAPQTLPQPQPNLSKPPT
jgi:hypothetical protein